MCDRSSSVAIAVPGVISAPGLTWRMPSTPANGRADRTIAQLRAHLVHLRLRLVARGALRVELRGGDELLLREFLLARVQLLRFLRRRFGRSERRLLLLAAERDEHRALAHFIAAVEMHGLHDLAHLRGDGDRIARTRRADGDDRIGEGLRLQHRGGHDDGRVGAVLAAIGSGGFVLAAARQGGGREQGDEQGKGTSGMASCAGF